MPVTVTDSSGQPVSGLQASDFIIEGKGIRFDSVESVIPIAVPVAVPGNAGQTTSPVFVLFDEVSVPPPFQGPVQKQLIQLLRTVAENYDRVTILVNTEQGIRVAHDLTTDPKVLSAALQRALSVESGAASTSVQNNATATEPAEISAEVSRVNELMREAPTKMTGLGTASKQFSGLQQVASMLQRSSKSKAVVWITDFFPFDMRDEGPIYAGNFYDLGWTYAKTVQDLNRARVAVYPLQVEGPTPRGEQTDRTHSGLEQFAEQTSGACLARGAALPTAISQVRSSVGPYYLLSLEVTPNNRVRWVRVKVKTKKAGARVHSAGGFVALR